MSCGRSGHGVAVGVESSFVARAAQNVNSSSLLESGGTVIGGVGSGGGSGGIGVNVSDLTVDDVGL